MITLPILGVLFFGGSLYCCLFWWLPFWLYKYKKEAFRNIALVHVAIVFVIGFAISLNNLGVK